MIVDMNTYTLESSSMRIQIPHVRENDDHVCSTSIQTHQHKPIHEIEHQHKIVHEIENVQMINISSYVHIYLIH
jgi:hypothetical protein